jgi:hypothetical protein
MGRRAKKAPVRNIPILPCARSESESHRIELERHALSFHFMPCHVMPAWFVFVFSAANNHHSTCPAFPFSFAGRIDIQKEKKNPAACIRNFRAGVESYGDVRNETPIVLDAELRRKLFSNK